MMQSLRTRLDRLHKRAQAHAGSTIIAIRFYGADTVTVGKQEMSNEDFKRLYPDAIEVNLTWGDVENDYEY